MRLRITQPRLIWVVAIGGALLGPTGILVAWLIFGDEPAAMTIGLAVGSGFGVYYAKPAWDHLLKQRLESNAPPGLSPGQRDDWLAYLRRSILRRRTEGEESQLVQMVRQQPLDLAIKESVVAPLDADGRSKLRVGGRTRPWSSVTDEWDRARGRLVILGDPGYGKTVTALRLLEHINSTEEPDRAVAELFQLVEWYRWRETHTGHLSDWLAHQLVTGYAIPTNVARELVAAGTVLPLLDGLDEVPDERRVACKDAIEAYVGASQSPRPFVLTCRAAEYAELAPDWVKADRQVFLIGLDVEQIVGAITNRMAGRRGWDTVKQRLASADSSLAALFRSPLRLSTALQAYRDRDPTDLLGRDLPSAQARLWDGLLALDAPSFEGHGAAAIRRWLEFLACGMARNARQRFWLHELYLMDEETHVREQKRFLFVVSSIPALAYSGLVLVGFPFPFGLLVALVCGPGFIWVAVHEGRLRAPAVHVAVSWQARRTAGWRAVVSWRTAGLMVMALILSAALLVATSDLELGISVAAMYIVGIPLGLAVLAMTRVSTTHIDAEPPRDLAGRGPGAVLAAGRARALWQGVVLGAATSVVIGVNAVVTFEGDYVGTVIVALASGLLVALGVAAYELVPWLYHYWLRWRLGAAGKLPRRLPQFLAWCAQPQRGWLRASDAYEFRHRELLDHLARGEPDRDRRAGAKPLRDSETAAAS